MNPILGNGIALAAVAALAWSCIRFLWRDTRRGGGCAGCGGCASCHGGCGGCAASLRPEAKQVKKT